MEPPSSFRELLDRYARGDRDFADVELDADPDCDLAGVCLDGADLSRAILVASFRGAALCSATFGSAKLDGADFAGAYIHSHTSSRARSRMSNHGLPTTRACQR